MVVADIIIDVVRIHGDGSEHRSAPGFRDLKRIAIAAGPDLVVLAALHEVVVPRIDGEQDADMPVRVRV